MMMSQATATPLIERLLAPTLTPLLWDDEAGLVMLDQRQLPQAVMVLTYTCPLAVAEAITTMVVRGAPAIGLAAAYGLALSVKQSLRQGLSLQATLTQLHQHEAVLRAARPTAVNLMACLDAQLAVLQAWQASPHANDTTVLLAELTQKALALHQADAAGNQAMGRYGAELMPDNAVLLTHCNAGALATGGYGTALGVVRATAEAGKLARIYANETRPRLQGAQLTCWELMNDNLPVTLLTDGMSGWLMQQRKVDAVVVGADRIARNGDAANKIGTYNLALVAKAHGVPFYVAAPRFTFDAALADGSGIPIEERCGDEVRVIEGQAVSPAGLPVWNPGFDVTPAHLITAFITEAGVFTPEQLTDWLT
jgi:methylthioribose-1-phosphate isomerase